MRTKPIVLSIGGSDPSSGAGIQADLRAFEATGVYGCTVITAITVQTATKVQRWESVSSNLIQDQLITLLDTYPIQWVKCGMLPTKECIDVILNAKERYKFHLIVDPIMNSSSGMLLMPLEVQTYFKTKMLPRVDVLTPNALEAESLTGLKIIDVSSILKIGQVFEKIGVKSVVFKGGHMDNNGNQIIDYLYEAGSMEMFTRTRINESSHIHGTGCIFASIFTAQLALTESTYEAMINTEQQIENAFRDLFYFPSQNSEISSYGITLDMGITQEERTVLEEVAEVYNFLRSQPSFIHLIPEVRTNISICLPNATKPQYVAAIEGRITVVNGLPHASGPIKFGVSNHTARLLLASHLKDPQIRAVINVKYLPNLIRPLSEKGLILYEIRRDKQSETVRTQEQSTMQWIIDSTFEQLKMIPDIIWDCGEPEKEPMIRLFARDGKNLIEKLQIILRTFKETYHSNYKT